MPSNTPSNVLKKKAREAIDSEYRYDTVLDPFEIRKDTLKDIKDRNQTTQEFTDIRYDFDSGQHVGFPKVNGYMEMPLPPEGMTQKQYNYLLANKNNMELKRPKNR